MAVHPGSIALLDGGHPTAISWILNERENRPHMNLSPTDRAIRVLVGERSLEHPSCPPKPRMAKTKLAVVITHPIQHFAPWFKEIANDRSVQLRVFYCTDWGATDYVDPEFGRVLHWDIPLLEGYPHEFLPIKRRPERMSFWQVDNPSVAQRLEAYEPDVLMVFGYAIRTSWRATAWAKRRRKPVLLISDSSLRGRKNVYTRMPQEVLVRKFYSNVDAAFSVGDDNRAFHISYGLPTERIYPGGLPIDGLRIQAGASGASAARNKIGVASHESVVLFIGKMVGHKRPEDLLKAAVQLSSPSTWFVFIGDGPLLEPLREAAVAEGLEKVRFLGFINQSEIPAFIGASDILAVTSELDRHPLVVTEGACAGLAIVCSDRLGCIGPADTAQPGVNALVYECGRPEALAAALDSLLGNKKRLTEMQRNSVRIGMSQDVRPLADALVVAVEDLVRKGVRSRERAVQ
jgi:glycosyltransferase involved in cell wall biosynthesis